MIAYPELYDLLRQGIDRGESSVSHSGCLTPGESVPSTRRIECSGNVEESLPLSGMEFRYHNRLARTLITILTELSRLFQWRMSVNNEWGSIWSKL
jgi:hypothetical protein